MEQVDEDFFAEDYINPNYCYTFGESSVNLVNALNLRSKNYQPLSWALDSKNIRFSDGETFNEDERVAFALGIQIANQISLKLAIEFPLASPRKAMALCCGVLIADFVARNKTQSLIDGDIFFITRQVGLGLAEMQSIHIEGNSLPDIWDIEKAATSRPRKSSLKPRVLLSAPKTQGLSPYKIQTGVLIIDASHPLTLERLEDILAEQSVVNIPANIVILPHGYTSTTSKFKDWTIISLPHYELSLETTISSVKFTVCSDEALDEQLSYTREKLNFLSRQFSTNPPIELLKAWGIYHRLSSMSVSLGKYEEHAHRHRLALPIIDRLRQLQTSHKPVLLGQKELIWESEWNHIVGSLLNSYEMLKGDVPSKFWAVALSLERAIELNFPKPIIVVCPTQMESDLLLRDLSFVCSDIHNYLYPDGLMFATPKSLAGQQGWQNHVILATGTYPAKWRYLYALFHVHETIVYPHEVESEERGISWIYADIQRRMSPQYCLSILPDLGLYIGEPMTEISTDFDNEIFQVQMTISNIEGLPIRKSPIDGIDHQLSLDIPSWAWNVEDVMYVPPLIGTLSNPEFRVTKSISSNFIDIVLENDTILQVADDQVFDVYRKITDEIDEVPAFQLAEGDILILILDSKYISLFDRIVEAYETHSNYALFSVWMKLWEIVKQEALQKCDGNFVRLRESIIDDTSTITEQAVRSWFSGVMAPREESLIYKIIEKSEILAAINHKAEIRSTLGHVRGMRRALGRRMHQMMRNMASLEQGTADNSLKGFENIAIEDVLAATEFATIKEIRFSRIE